MERNKTVLLESGAGTLALCEHKVARKLNPSSFFFNFGREVPVKLLPLGST